MCLWCLCRVLMTAVKWIHTNVLAIDKQCGLCVFDQWCVYATECPVWFITKLLHVHESRLNIKICCHTVSWSGVEPHEHTNILHSVGVWCMGRLLYFHEVLHKYSRQSGPLVVAITVNHTKNLKWPQTPLVHLHLYVTLACSYHALTATASCTYNVRHWSSKCCGKYTFRRFIRLRLISAISIRFWNSARRSLLIVVVTTIWLYAFLMTLFPDSVSP